MGLQVTTQSTGRFPPILKFEHILEGKLKYTNEKEGEQRVLEHFGTFLWKNTEKKELLTNRKQVPLFVGNKIVSCSWNNHEGTKFSGEASVRPQKRPNISTPSRSTTRGGFLGVSGGRFNKPQPNLTVSRGSNIQVKPTCQTCGR